MVIILKMVVFMYTNQRKKHKFFRIASHLQGLDQLEYNQPYQDMFIFERQCAQKDLIYY